MFGAYSNRKGLIMLGGSIHMQMNEQLDIQMFATGR